MHSNFNNQNNICNDKQPFLSYMWWIHEYKDLYRAFIFEIMMECYLTLTIILVAAKLFINIIYKIS